MKEDCQTVWILQDRTTALLGCKCALFFQTGRMTPKGSSEIFRASSLVHKGEPLPYFQQPTALCPKLWGQAAQATGCSILVLQNPGDRTSAQQSCSGKTTALVGLEGRVWNQRGVLSTKYVPSHTNKMSY